MSDLPRGKNADYWEGFHSAEAARTASAVAKSLRKDNARKCAVIERHPQHFFSLDAQAVGEMSGHEAAAHSLKQDGFKLLADEDALRMREAVDHGIKLGFARARGSGDSMLFGGHGSAGTHESDDSSGSMTEAEKQQFFAGTKGGPEAASNLLGVAEKPKRAPLDSAHDSAGHFMDRYLKVKG